MYVLKPSPRPQLPRGDSMEAIFDGDVRRASATEQCVLNVPWSVSAGSKHDDINIIIHSNDQPPIGRYYGY